jgi:hypothetical protein
MKTSGANRADGGRQTRRVLRGGHPQPLLTVLGHWPAAPSASGRAQTSTWRRVAARFCLGLVAAFASFRAAGQSYSIDWYKVAGGGGASTGGTYQVSGTIGQPDASGALTGGPYSVTGGFWALISVVPTAGLPNLTVAHAGNTVIVSWPDTGSYTLQQNPNVADPAGWVTSAYPITPANGTNQITVAPAAGILYFRLKQ